LTPVLLLQRFDTFAIFLLHSVLILLKPYMLLLCTIQIRTNNRNFPLLLLCLLPQLADQLGLLIVQDPQLIELRSKRSICHFIHFLIFMALVVHRRSPSRLRFQPLLLQLLLLHRFLLNGQQLGIHQLINSQGLPPFIMEAVVAFIFRHTIRASCALCCPSEQRCPFDIALYTP